MARMMATEVATIVMVKMAITILFLSINGCLLHGCLSIKIEKKSSENALAEKCLNASLNLIGKFVPNLC